MDGRRFSFHRPPAPLLLLLLQLAVVVLIKQASYCSATAADELDELWDGGSRAAPLDERNPRQAHLLGEAIGFVGRALSGNKQSLPWGIWGRCPTEPRKPRDYQHVFMRFRRPDDTMDSELRVDASSSTSSGWDEQAIDLMVSDYGFDPKKPTLMYTGGWKQDTMEHYLKAIRENYRRLYAKTPTEPGFNLLFFDWSRFAFDIYYNSVSRVPHLSERMAAFFEYLHKKHGYDLSQLHLITYSLSTHIGGLAARQLAERTGQRVGQLTYMDPTGVCFHDGRPWGEKWGARHDDAQLTVAKHYNMNGLGSHKLIGGLDVIINDGQRQPLGLVGEGQQPLLVAAGMALISHLRAAVHEKEPFKPEADCHEIAYACSSLDRFRAGECGSCGPHNRTCYLVNTLGNLQLGIDLKKIGFTPGTVMYLSKGLDQPCVYQYQVVVNLSGANSTRLGAGGTRSRAASSKKGGKRKESARQASSSLDLAFEPSAGVRVAPMHMKDNKLYQLVSLVNRIQSFKPKIDMKKARDLAQVSSIEINYLSHVSPKMREQFSFKYCPDLKAGELIKCP